MRRLAKLANKKTASQLQLEQCVETSVLMTLAGVDSIVLNGWASSLTANRRLVLRLMASLTGGKSIGESLAEAMEKESGAGGGGSSGNSSKANSRPSSKGKGGGKKKEAKVVKNIKAGGEEEQKPARLKWRVKANALVFGLPHVVVKK